MTESTVEPVALRRHLAEWLGRWPALATLDVVGSVRRTEPGWDGRLHPLVGVLSPAGAVLSVSPDAVDDAAALVAGDSDDWHAGLPALLGHPGRPIAETVLRFTDRPAPLPDAGVWISSAHPALPEWLRPFGPKVLASLDERGRYMAGLGLKRHSTFGRELAVGTEPSARGAGLARRLVAQACRAVLAGGAVPTYRHEQGNAASARVADAAGLPNLGWRHLGLAETNPVGALGVSDK